VYETAKTRICDVADRQKDANLHFGVSLKESRSDGEMAVGSVCLN